MAEGSEYSWYKPHHGGQTSDPYATRPSMYPPLTDQSAYPPYPSTYPPYPPPSQPPPQHAYPYAPSYPPYSNLGGPPSHWKNPLLEELRQIARLSFENNPNQPEFLAKYGFFDSPSSLYAARFALPDLRKAIPEFDLSNIFSVVDEKRSGYVDFWGLITILYALDCKLYCHNCHELVFGAKFWCEECLAGASKASFGLCFTCFQNRKDLHQHQEFINSHFLFERFLDAKSEAMKASNTKKESQVPEPQQLKNEQMSILEQQMFIQQQQQQLEMARMLGQMMVSGGNAVNDLAPGYYKYI